MKAPAVLVLEAEVAKLRAQLVAMDEEMTRGTDEAKLRRYEDALRLIAANSSATLDKNMAARHLATIALRALGPIEERPTRTRCASFHPTGTPCVLLRGHEGAHYDSINKWSNKKRGRGLQTNVSREAMDALALAMEAGT